jgi:redox-sensitive bicupin YhaK (pirin superfamily)
MDTPEYQPLTAEQTPVIASQDGLAVIHVIAGELDGVKGPINTLSPVNTFTAELKKGATYYFRVPETHNAFIYLLDGKLKVTGDGEVEGKYVAVFNNDGAGFELEAMEDTRLFIGTGEPLNEPVASHGPFVMNNQTELMEAFRDYQMGKMGVLIEE